MTDPSPGITLVGLLADWRLCVSLLMLLAAVYALGRSSGGD